jgi:hypothetical protein
MIRRKLRRDEVEVYVTHTTTDEDTGEETEHECRCICRVDPGERSRSWYDPDVTPSAEVLSSTCYGQEVDLTDEEQEAAHEAAVEAMGVEDWNDDSGEDYLEDRAEADREWREER